MSKKLNLREWNAKIWRQRIRRNRELIKESLKQPNPCDLINDYTSQSSVHGLRYVSNVKANIIEKTFWFVALILSTMAACLLAAQLWKRYSTIPTVLAVKDTHLPLYLFPFPSITVCPATKVKKSVAMDYFSSNKVLECIDQKNLIHRFPESTSEVSLLLLVDDLQLEIRGDTYFRLKKSFTVQEILTYRFTCNNKCRTKNFYSAASNQIWYDSANILNQNKSALRVRFIHNAEKIRRALEWQIKFFVFIVSIPSILNSFTTLIFRLTNPMQIVFNIKAIIDRYVNTSNENTRKYLVHVMSALSMMQQPTYFRMKPHVRQSRHLFILLKEINVTDFMLTTLPECSELFGICNWHGEQVNCCDIFSLQRTEEGFCYAFNSLTSEGGKHCPLSEVLENEGIVEEDDIMYEGCQLRRNTAVGTVTGLEVFFNKCNELETLGYGQKDLNGIRVIVHTSYEYPNAGDGIWVPEQRNKRISITVYPSITVTSDSVKNLNIHFRGCVFPDEKDLHIYHVYTESSCLIECRLHYIADRCNCYMYYFPSPDDEKPICGTLHLECIMNYAPYMRLQRPPDNTPGFDPEAIKRSLNCSHCIPTCYETEHDLEVDQISDSHLLSNIYYGHLDVAYGNLGATKYQRDITFTWTDLLVSLGGVANLFLGFSLLSAIEFIYWIVRTIIIVFWKNHKRKRKLMKVFPIQRITKPTLSDGEQKNHFRPRNIIK